MHALKKICYNPALWTQVASSPPPCVLKVVAIDTSSREVTLVKGGHSCQGRSLLSVLWQHMTVPAKHATYCMRLCHCTAWLFISLFKTWRKALLKIKTLCLFLLQKSTLSISGYLPTWRSIYVNSPENLIMWWANAAYLHSVHSAM